MAQITHSSSVVRRRSWPIRDEHRDHVTGLSQWELTLASRSARRPRVMPYVSSTTSLPSSIDLPFCRATRPSVSRACSLQGENILSRVQKYIC